MNTKKLVRIAVLTAAAILLMHTIFFPIPPFPNFLTYDPGDIPGLLATFAWGPLGGLLVQFLKCTLGYFLGASKAGAIGMAANFVSGGTMVLIAGMVYQQHKTLKMAILALVCGAVAAALIMALANYFVFFPLWGFPTTGALTLIVKVVFPFNLVKYSISSLVTFLIYKRTKRFFVEEA